MERQNLDTNLQLSGQQIVVLTAGTGYFEVLYVYTPSLVGNTHTYVALPCLLCHDTKIEKDRILATWQCSVNLDLHIVIVRPSTNFCNIFASKKI